jgi:hypothetical protein
VIDRPSTCGCVANSSGCVRGINTEQMSIQHLQQKNESYVHATLPLVQSGTMNVLTLPLRTTPDDRNGIFGASERDLPEFLEFLSGINNLVGRPGFSATDSKRVIFSTWRSICLYSVN